MPARPSTLGRVAAVEGGCRGYPMTMDATMDVTEDARSPLVGILAGGSGRRMGGADKGRLRAPSGEALLPRLLRLCRERSLDAVVVGGAAPTGVACLADEPAGVGPIGGLCALLARAGARPALLLACDLPYLEAPLLERLARSQSDAPVLAARDPLTGKWQPMFARYASAELLPPLRRAIADGTRSLQTFLRTVQVAELPLDDAEQAQLRDWDRPEDVG